MSGWIWLLLAVILILMLAGCAAGPKPSLNQIEPVCTALIGPIPYNTYSPKSRRFAGPALAPDLKRRNQVGQNLGCPAYRRFPW
jgi:hypothetical protein